MTLPHPHHERWVPYTDPKTGQVVTITWEQVAAVLHAVRVVDEARAEARKRRAEGARGPNTEDYPSRLYQDFPEKSRALGRLLVDGKPLFKDVPPSAEAACNYYLWDRENKQATTEPPVLTIDPARQFGRVCVEGTRVTAEALAEQVAAGEPVDSVAEDYGCTREQVLLACWWEVQVTRNGPRRSKRDRGLLVAWVPWADNVDNFKALGHWDGAGECPDPPEVGADN